MSQRLHRFRQMFARTLLSRVFRIHTKSRKQNGGSSHCLWWAHYLWNVCGNEDWSPSRSNSIYCDRGLYVSHHAQLLAVVYAIGKGAASWEQTRQDDMLTKTITASFHMRRYCCLMAGMRSGVEGSPSGQDSWNTWHAQRTHTCVKGEPGACDVATEVINTHSFPCWQNVKIDSGAGRWKGQWACFEQV